MRSTTTDDSEDDLDLARLQAGFPQFAIWRETGYSRPRYIVRSLQPGTHPHTLITSDLAEPRTQLSAGGSA
jgi:hypothetical protein